MEYITSYHELGEMLESVAALHNKSQDAKSGMMFESNKTSPSMQWQCVENRLSMSEIEILQTISFWVEGVGGDLGVCDAGRDIADLGEGNSGE